jgi:nitrogen fixation-related uncharacterized protein
MIYIVIALILIFFIIIAIFLHIKSKYYDNLFSENHYAKIYDWLKERILDNTAFSSSSGCVFTFTCKINKKDVIHFAISQIESPTTHSVCGHLAFLILQILNNNEAEANFFFTESSVHHLIFSKESGTDWIVNEKETVLTAMNSAEPILFRFQSAQEV